MNILAAIEPITKHLEQAKADGILSHVRAIKSVPVFDEVKGNRYTPTDRALYVYPVPMTIDKDLAEGKTVETILPVALTFTTKVHDVDKTTFHRAAGETGYQVIQVMKGVNHIRVFADGSHAIFDRSIPPSAEQKPVIRLIRKGFGKHIGSGYLDHFYNMTLLTTYKSIIEEIT